MSHNFTFYDANLNFRDGQGDRLLLYDGDSKSSLFIGYMPEKFISSKNNLFLHFQSNGIDDKSKGFKLEYHSYSKMFKDSLYIQGVTKKMAPLKWDSTH